MCPVFLTPSAIAVCSLGCPLSSLSRASRSLGRRRLAPPGGEVNSVPLGSTISPVLWPPGGKMRSLNVAFSYTIHCRSTLFVNRNRLLFPECLAYMVEKRRIWSDRNLKYEFQGR